MNRRLRAVLLWTVTPLLLAVVLFALGVIWPLPEVEPVVTDHPVAFVGVAVVDVERGVTVSGRTVLIEDGRIAAVGDSLDLPPDAEVVDARGHYLMPALWDMHTHVLAVSPLLELPLYVSYGVTNVRDMLSCPQPGDPFISCPEDKRRWTEEAERGERVGPRVVSSASFMANGPTMRERLPDAPAFFGTATPEQARALRSPLGRPRRGRDQGLRPDPT